MRGLWWWWWWVWALFYLYYARASASAVVVIVAVWGLSTLAVVYVSRVKSSIAHDIARAPSHKIQSYDGQKNHTTTTQKAFSVQNMKKTYQVHLT